MNLLHILANGSVARLLSAGFFYCPLWLKVIGSDCSGLWHLDSISSLKCCCRSETVVSPAKLLQWYWMACQCPIQSALKLSADSTGFNSLVLVMRKHHASNLHFWNACGECRRGFSISPHSLIDALIYCSGVGSTLFFSFCEQIEFHIFTNINKNFI